MGSSTGADHPRHPDVAAPPTAHPSVATVNESRWRRLFDGEERQLGVMRRWIKSLLPDCPARDDAISVATELASNALLHTASGNGGSFAVEIARDASVVLVSVADRGGPTEPHVIDDPDGEHGRGLALVHGLSARTGVVGGQHGRTVWAEISWGDADTPAPASPQAGYEAEIRAGEAALARRFAGVPAWFGRATQAWWALAGPDDLVTAPTAPELASLLYRLLEESPSHGPSTRHVRATRYPLMTA